MKTKHSIIGLKELREKTGVYISRIGKGESFTVVRRSRPIFKLTSPDIEDEDDDGKWKTIIDFTKIKKGGVPIEEVLASLERLR